MRHKSPSMLTRTVIITPEMGRPTGAEIIEYTFKSLKYHYMIWPASYPHGHYYWQACGNGGKVPSKAEACEAAREYIQNGPQNGRRVKV